MKYCLYPGRFQPAHLGHKYIFDKALNDGKAVCIAIRDIYPDENNPLSAREVLSLWEKIYQKEIISGIVKVIIIPDIECVRYGRGVGWGIEQIEVPQNISNISATDIRNKIRSGDDSWKLSVHEAIHDDLEKLLSHDFQET